MKRGWLRPLGEKIRESLASVLPISGVVLLLSVTLSPLSTGTMVMFLFGALMLIFGMGLFTVGVDLSMMPMGEGIGVEISKSRRLQMPLILCFLLGTLITIAEPDLQLLARQVPSIPNMVLFLTGVNEGFMSAGYLLGKTIASSEHAPLLVPIGMIIGYFIVAAEPAVHVLNRAQRKEKCLCTAKESIV